MVNKLLSTKQLELSLLVKDKTIQDLNLKINELEYKLKEKQNKLDKLEKFIKSIVIFKDNEENYQLSFYTKQELYKKLFELRYEILEGKDNGD